MAAVNSVSSPRLPLPTFSPRALLMYRAAVGGEGSVALQLREATAADVCDAIACPEPELLAGLLQAADIGPEHEGLTALLGASSPDLTLTSDTSDSLPLSDIDNDVLPVSSGGGNRLSGVRMSLAGFETAAPAAKKVRPKPASPNRQGPQQCQVCNKVFGNASALAKHKLTHSDERKYVCTVCSKAFKRQDHLNGHMLTHRNKKPFECKADGCGKSYCDARSLRRHTENHHQDPSKRRMSESASTVVHEMDKDAPQTSPRAATPAPPPRNHTPHSDSSSASFDKLCASLMTSSASQPAPVAPITPLTPVPPSPPARPLTPLVIPTPRPRPPVKSKAKTYSGGSSLQQGSSKIGDPSCAGAGSASGCTPQPKPLESKPVECNLCHRKFKNIPALNGHMRLHGGYFKKDSDTKKLDKKETSGPPLQTASVSVRALIEEKIISRRTATGNASATSSSDTSASSRSFVTPAPPPLSTSRSTVTSTSTITSSTSSSQFVSPRPPAAGATSTVTGSTSRDSALIELLKKGNGSKVVKRSASDPGQASPQHEFTFRPELFGVSFNSDDGYFSPALNDDAFHFSTTPEQMDEFASLEDYATVAASIRDRSPVTFPSSRKLAAVLNSPLPESLADFGACHGGSPVHSPGMGYAESSAGLSYAAGGSVGPAYVATSPGGYAASSPGGYAAQQYPTPPASLDAPSPLSAPRASSPLTAAFFTATMSSQEEVEEALEEVLPEECGSLDAYALDPSPTPRRIMLNSEDPLLSSSPRDFANQRPFRRLQRVASTSQMPWQPDQPGTSLQVCVEGRDSVPPVFLSPSSVPPSPRRKRRGSPASTAAAAAAAGPHRSRMRRGTTHYTPAPMLPPDRDGTGLLVELTGDYVGEEEPPYQREWSQRSRVNVGAAHQAAVPALRGDRPDLHRTTEQLLWDPGINDRLDDGEVRMFMELAMCAAMPVGGHTREAALQTLGECGGDVRAAALRLMCRPEPAAATQRWAPEEVEAFLTGLRHYDKDFFKIAQLIRTKDSKQVIQFYYFWKKVTKDYKSIFVQGWAALDPDAAVQSTSKPTTSQAHASCTSSPAPYEGEEFPCKICGKVFNKVKSRSAHMKSHRSLDGEPKRQKIEKPCEKVDERTQSLTDSQSKN